MVTGYVTDTRFEAHTLSGHPENASRLNAVQALMVSSGTEAKLKAIPPIRATDEQILLVHRKNYLDLLYRTETMGGVMLGPDTYVLAQSFETARWSAGSALAAVDALLTGEVTNALVAARPPGHHAVKEQGMGFCLLNNVSMAARYAQRAYPGIERVMIVDFDVHHGNGTQDIFYADPSVFFASTHQYPWYPGSGSAGEIGEGEGLRATLNMPLGAGAGDDCFKALYEQVLWPLARRFAPQLLFVSAGFDAHWAEDSGLGQLKLTLPGYTWLTRQLKAMAEDLCDGKIIVVLEGGYNLVALANGVVNAARILLDSDAEALDPLGPAPRPMPATAVEPLIAELRRLHNLS